MPAIDTRLFLEGMAWMLALRDNAFVLAHIPVAAAGELHDLRLRALYDAGRFDEVLAARDGGLPRLFTRLSAGLPYEAEGDDGGTPNAWRFVDAAKCARLDARWRAGDHAGTWPEYRLREANQRQWAVDLLAHPAPFDRDLAACVLDHADLLEQADARAPPLAAYVLRRLERGQTDQALAILARLGWADSATASVAQEGATIGETLVLVPLLLDLDAGRPFRRDHLEAQLPWLDQCVQRQLWFIAQAILGHCDHATFLAQPVRVEAEVRWDLAQGIACELRHDLAGAAAAYARIPPPYREPNATEHFAVWRLGVLQRSGVPVTR